MKLKNRIMSWILSPGAYAVWHALGAPEEWLADPHTLRHCATGVQLWTSSGPFFLDAHYDGQLSSPGAIGYFERYLLWPRAWRARRVLRRKLVSARKQANMDIFKKLTVNE